LECGDSSPPYQAKFISPVSRKRIEQNLAVDHCRPMDFPIQGGDESPHSKSVAGRAALLAIQPFSK